MVPFITGIFVGAFCVMFIIGLIAIADDDDQR